MSIKIMNLNLWFGGELMDALLDYTLAQNPDIFIAQEVYHSEVASYDLQYRSVSTIQQVVGFKYCEFSPAFEEVKPFGKVIQGNAIFSHHPSTLMKTLFYDVPFSTRDKTEGHLSRTLEFTPRNLQHVVVHHSSGNINIFNTQGIWGKDGVDNPRRIKMAQTILDAVGDLKPTIIAGDFNVQQNTETIQMLESKFINVFKDSIQSSFNLQRKSNPVFSTIVVDMVFVSSDISLKMMSCPQVDVSDHLPMIITIDL